MSQACCQRTQLYCILCEWSSPEHEQHMSRDLPLRILSGWTTDEGPSAQTSFAHAELPNQPPSICTLVKFPSCCFQAPAPKAAPTAPTQQAPTPAVRPPVPSQSLQPGLLPYGQPRAAPKPTFRPAALRLDDQGREIDEFGNLVQNRTDSITTLKVLPHQQLFTC